MPTTKSVRKPTPAANASPVGPKPGSVAVKAAKAPAGPAAPVVAKAPAKVKNKLVRDSVTIPKSEYAVLDGLKQRAANLTRPAKKSELLRAGIKALDGMSDKAFLAALAGVPSLKTGRPKGGAPK